MDKIQKIPDTEVIYLTSDLHFFHDNIIEHCERPCTIEVHVAWILNKINSVVKPGDIVYHLGDFAYGSNAKFSRLQEVFSQLNGTWRFIIGNHDKEKQLEALCQGTPHEVLGEYHSFYYKKRKIVMLHYPMETWDGKGRGRNSIHFHGHIHNKKITEIENRHNVCLDNEHKVYLLDDFL